MSRHKVFAATEVDSEENENALHIAAKLAPPHRLNAVTGAALQMQRELQWFQGKVTWIAAPLVVGTSIPVCLFGLLQFPLLVELVNSTYGRSIFHQQNARRIH
ncbi:hypothetical protein L1987_67315 [Smallanthus sonchifolius]|uniref:Uncharacterized protein n=1 Tax=Smallanthus sonchifolius TaxID=185202 RepID=A0ACB9B3B3_9ASTR|nr:hypothetical protein L1987_67315 [Smallanthus sonchifolius]